MDYRKVAEQIYEKVGKKENLVSAAHCATRLRLVIADNGKCDLPIIHIFLSFRAMHGTFFCQPPFPPNPGSRLFMVLYFIALF